MRQTWDPDHRLQKWCALGAWRHALALGLFSAAALGRWHACLLASEVRIDEATYLAAFRATSAGGSPYDIVSYHYTPWFAWIGARLVETLGDSGTVGVLRGASVAGLALTVWCALAFLDTALWKRLAVGVAFVALAPAVGAGFCTGNISFVAIGVILLSLMLWPRGSLATGAVPAGLALGATVAAKPLAPLALVALFCHRPELAENSRRKLAAGAAGSLAATALLLPMLGHLREMAAQPIHPLSFTRSFSLTRILSLFGLELSPLAILSIAAILVACLVRSRRLDRSRLLAVATTASILATPMIWNHTLVLTLPLQVMALTLAASRRRAAVTGDRGRFSELVFVALGALALGLSEGFGAVDEFPRLAQAAFLLVPYLAPAGLLAYVLRAGAARRNR